MAAAVQPSCLWNSQKTCYKTFPQPAAPDCTLLFMSHLPSIVERARPVGTAVGLPVAHPDLGDVLLLAADDLPGEPTADLDVVDLTDAEGALLHLYAQHFRVTLLA